MSDVPVIEYEVRWRKSGIAGQLRTVPFATRREIVIGDTLVTGDGDLSIVCLRVLSRVIREDERPTVLICCETVNVFEAGENGCG